MALLTDQDKSFVQNLKGQGYSREDAFAALAKVKQAKGDKTFTFGERFMQNLKAAPEAIFGKDSVTQKILGSVPLVGDALNKVPEAIGQASDMAIHGVESVAQGAEEINKGVPDIVEGIKSGDKEAISNAVVDTVGGTSQAIGGGLETAFAVPVTLIKQLPYGEEVLTGISEGVNYVSSGLGEAMGTDEKSKQVLTESFNNLFMLLGAKYGPKATESIKASLEPYIAKAGEALTSKAESIPKIQMGEPLTDVVKTASEQGVDLPLSATTGSEFVRSVEALQKNGIFSGELLSKSEAATAKIADLTTKATEKLGTSDLSKFDIGNTFKEGFEQVKDVFKSTKNDLYDAADAVLTQSKVKGKFIAPPTETLAALNELIGRSKKSLAPTAAADFWVQLKNGFSKGKITVDTLRQTLQDIGKRMKDHNDPIVTGDKTGFSKIYSSLSRDLDAFYSERAPAFKEAISKANDYYKQNINLINGEFGSMVERATPEQIYSKFVKPNNPTALGEMRQIVGNESFARISGVFLKDILEKSVRKDVFSIDAFKKELGRWDSKTLETILDKKQMARLEEVKTQLGSLEKIQDAVKAGEAKFKGSQTGFLNAVSKLKGLAMGGGGAGAYLAAGPLGVVASAVLYVLGDLVTSKFLLSDFAKKLVSTGVEVPGVGSMKSFGEFITKNADAVSQIMSNSAVSAPVVSPTQATESEMEPQMQ